MPAYRVTIKDLHEAYAGGGDPQVAVKAAYARLASVDDPGIFIHLVPQAEALAACAALPPYDPVRFPLWGVPFAVKDNIDVAGLPTTAACPAFAYVPTRSATAVERLVAAGAIVMGKTNLDQFATGLVGVRSPYPVPRNAIDPTRVPGGSSSGSAVAVGQGIVAFSLGTDTAGSGRVPAALNDIVGLKPSLGAVSTRGVVPACRTLDCVSVFAQTIEDAFRVYGVMRGFDAEDAYSRPVVDDEPFSARPIRRLGVPRAADRLFFGDTAMTSAFDAALKTLLPRAESVIEIDMTPFFEVARLLYEGPWVAERHAAIRDFMARSPEALHPVTAAIIGNAGKFSATDAFRALYRLADLRRAAEPVWQSIDALVVPTNPVFPTLADLAADPIGPNSRLGTYTNFVNLMDLAALAVPGPWRTDGLPAGVTLVGPRGADAALAAFALPFEQALTDGRYAARSAAA
uniref:allophanate hydrolase n=1 Tax=Phreatobacter aquaticus TaxID=2570229 RepID=UPI00268ACEB0|nr:allophanate hydrolase [Phreatobacter aquaticus]